MEAAAFGGRLVWLEVIRSSKPVDAGAPSPLTLDQVVQTTLPPVLQLIVILFAAFLARRNLKASRGDMRGASRPAAVFLVLGTAIDLLDASSSVSAVAAI